MFFVQIGWNEALSKAILSALLNAEKLDVGPNLTSFKDEKSIVDFQSEFFHGFSQEMRFLVSILLISSFCVKKESRNLRSSLLALTHR